MCADVKGQWCPYHPGTVAYEEREPAYSYARLRHSPLVPRQRFPFARAWLRVQTKVQP
jgi:hypothetical protein